MLKHIISQYNRTVHEKTGTYDYFGFYKALLGLCLKVAGLLILILFIT